MDETTRILNSGPRDVSESSLEPQPTVRRFFVLAMYLLLTFSNEFQFTQMSTTVRESQEFFDCSAFFINLMPIFYFVAASLLAFPTVVFFEKYGLRVGLVLGTSLNLIGAGIKFVACTLEQPNIYLLLTGQGFSSIGQMATISLASLVSFTWFPAPERARATSTGGSLALLGEAAGVLVPPLVIDGLGEHNREGFLIVFGLPATLALISFLGTVLAVPNEPSHPPCAASLVAKKEMEEKKRKLLESGMSMQRIVWEGLKELSKNRNFLVAVLMLCLTGCTLFGLVTVVSQLLLPFGVPERHTGVALSSGMILGSVSSYFIGKCIDKHRKYKLPLEIFISVFSLCQLSVAAVGLWGGESLGEARPWLMVSLIGLAVSSLIPRTPVMFEFVAELSFPTNPIVAPTLCFWSVCVFCTIFDVAIAGVLGNQPSRTDGIVAFSIIGLGCFLCNITFHFFVAEDLRRKKAEDEVVAKKEPSF